MKSLKLEEIAEYINAKYDFTNDVVVSSVSTDTRTLKQGDLYFALKGKNYDGHNFVKIAEKKGACAIVCSKEIETSLPILRVENTLQALQDLAKNYRKNLKTKVVAVTGSTGKTTTKNMIASVLCSKYKVFWTDKNYNNEIGLPKSILELDDSYDIAVLEMGMNHLGEISNLSKIAEPDFAVITNIGSAHIGSLGSKENILKAKLEVLDGLNRDGTVILNSDDEFLKNIKLKNIKTIFFGIKNKDLSDIFAYNISKNELGSEFEVKYSKEKFLVFLSTFGKHNVLNALAAIILGFEFKIDKDYIIDALKDYISSPMRFEVCIINGIKIIKDYYNSSPESAKIALENLSQEKSNGKKVAILGQIAELGSFSKEKHFELGNLCKNLKLDYAFFIGKDSKSFQSGMQEKCKCFKENQREDLLNSLKKYIKILNNGDVILIKGSRNTKMEEFYESLKRYIQGEDFNFSSLSSTRLYIDVNAIKFNYLQIKKALKNGVEIMPMVKANAYGAGSDIISSLFKNNQYLAIADVKEASIVRKKLPHANLVIIYQPSYEDVQEIIKGDYISAVSDITFAKKLNQEAKIQGKISKIHIEVDTGHGRLGVNIKDIDEFAKEILKLKNLKVEGIFMHYSSADEFDQQDIDFTKMQTEKFTKAVEKFENILGKIKFKHACAGAAIFNEYANQFNMVRPGYILYGYYPCESLKEKINLKPSLKFTSSILQIREVEKGTPISYNRRYITKRPSKIATIAVGYSDGILRSLFSGENTGFFVVNGQKAPIVGTICMDLTMIDITDIEGEVKVGNEIAIFDNVNVTVDEMAKTCKTIGYEIICGIAEKANRIEIF